MAHFHTCWERIFRASKHRDALVDLWNRFLEEEPYTAGVQMEDDGTERIFVEPRYESLPSAFALELGELLYQLRAALDTAVYEAAILDSGKNPPPNERSLQFPIVATEEKFGEARRSIAPLSEERKSIIESLQPYRAPKLAPAQRVYNSNRAIGILGDWARKDRHRKLHVLMSWAGNIAPMLRVPDGAELVSLTVAGDGFLERKSEIAVFKLTGWMPQMWIEANPNLTIDISIDETPSQEGPTDTLGNRIDSMFMAVRQIVTSLERASHS